MLLGLAGLGRYSSGSLPSLGLVAMLLSSLLIGTGGDASLVFTYWVRRQCSSRFFLGLVAMLLPLLIGLGGDAPPTTHREWGDALLANNQDGGDAPPQESTTHTCLLLFAVDDVYISRQHTREWRPRVGLQERQ